MLKIFDKLNALLVNKLVKRPVKNHRPISAHATHTQLSWIDKIDRWTFNWEIRHALYRHLAAQIQNKVPIEAALNSFCSRLHRQNKKTPEKIVRSVSRLMRDGKTFGQAIAKWVPAFEASLINSGIESGKLVISLQTIIKAQLRKLRIKRAFKGAAKRPLVLATVIFAFIWGVGYYLAPMLHTIMPKDKAKGLGASLYAIADISQSPLLFLIPVIAGAFWLLLQWSKPRWTGRYRILAEQYFFPYRFYRDMEGYGWLVGFLGLMQAGKSDVTSLDFQIKTATPWLKERLTTFKRQLIDGATLPTALSSGNKKKRGLPPFNFPNPDIIEDITSVAGFSGFEGYVEKIADQWVDELERTSLQKAEITRNLIDFTMYAIVFYVVLSVYSLNNQISIGTMSTFNY